MLSFCPSPRTLIIFAKAFGTPDVIRMVPSSILTLETLDLLKINLDLEQALLKALLLDSIDASSPDVEKDVTSSWANKNKRG